MMHKKLKNVLINGVILTLITPAYISSYSQLALAEVSDISSMSKLPNGQFSVQCLNGRLEKVSAEQILNNSVCRYNNSSSPNTNIDKQRVKKLCQLAQAGDGNTLYYPSGQVMTFNAGEKGATWYYPNGQVITYDGNFLTVEEMTYPCEYIN